MPKKYRKEFRKPIGKIYRNIADIGLKGTEKIIVVGDVTYLNLLNIGISPYLAIIDFKTKRKERKFEGKLEEVTKVSNPPGKITQELWDKIKEKIKNGGIILVEGEEDLAVLPCILEADEKTILLYGQPDEGVVKVTINKKTKEKARELLKLMEVEK